MASCGLGFQARGCATRLGRAAELFTQVPMGGCAAAVRARPSPMLQRSTPRYTEDAPVSLGRNVRQNENCVWLADDSLWRPIWRRIAAHMPPLVKGGAPAGCPPGCWRLQP